MERPTPSTLPNHPHLAPYTRTQLLVAVVPLVVATAIPAKAGTHFTNASHGATHPVYTSPTRTWLPKPASRTFAALAPGAAISKYP